MSQDASPPPTAAGRAVGRAVGRTVLKASARLYQHITSHLILLLAFLGLVYFLVYFTINSNYARRVFDEVVNGKVFRGRIQWDRIAWGPWPSELHIQRPVLLDAEGHVVIRVEEVDLSLDLLALTEGAIVARDIVIDTPIIKFREVPFEDGFGQPGRTLNIAAMFMPPVPMPDAGQPGAPPRMAFYVSEIRNGRYHMDLPSIDVDCRGLWVEDAFFEMRPNPSGSGPPLMRMGAHSVQSRDVMVAIPKVAGPEVQDGLRAGPSASKRPPEEVWRWRARSLKVRDFTWKDWAFRTESITALLGAPAGKDTLDVQGFTMGLLPGQEPSIGGRLRLNLVDLGPHLRMFGLDGISGPVELDIRTGGELMSQSGGGTITSTGLALPGGLRTGALALNLRHENNRVDLQSISVEVGDGQLSGHAYLDGERGRAMAELLLAGVTPAEVGLELGDVDDGPVGDLLRGRISGAVDAKLTDLWAERPTISAEMDLDLERPDALESPLPPHTRLEATAVLSGPSLDVRSARITAGDDRVTASGNVDLLARTVSADAEVRIEDLRPYSGLARLPISGSVDVKVGANGPWEAPDARIDLRAQSVSYDGLPATTLAVAAQLNDKRLKVRELTALSGDTRVTLSGDADLSRPSGRVALQGQLEHVDLAAWARGQPVTGQADARFTGGGTLRSPQLDVKLTIARASWDGQPRAPHARIEAHVRSVGLENPLVTIESLEVRTLVGELNARGTLRPLDPKAEANLQVSLKAVDLSGLPLPSVGTGSSGTSVRTGSSGTSVGAGSSGTSVGTGSSVTSVGAGSSGTSPAVSGLLSGDVTLTGPLVRPAIGGRLVIEDPHFRTLTFRRLEVSARYSGDALNVDRLVLVSAQAPGEQPRALVTVTGMSLGLETLAFQGKISLDRVPLALANHFVVEPLPLRGTLSAELTGSGTTKDPGAKGSISLAAAGFDDFNLGDVSLVIEAADHRLRVDGTLFEDTALSVSLPTTPGEGPATFTMRFTDLSPEKYVGALSEANIHTRMTGTLSGGHDLFSRAPIQDNPPFISLDMTDLRVSHDGLDLVNVEPIQATYRDGALTLSRFSLSAAGQKLRVEGTLSKHQVLDATVDGQLELGLLQGLLSGTFSGVQGQASLVLRVQGPLDDPHAEGRIKLSRLFLVPRSSVVGSEIELMEPVELWIQSEMGPAAAPTPPTAAGGPANGRRGRYVVTMPRHVPAEGATGGPTTLNRMLLRRDDGRIALEALDLSLENFLPESLSVRLDADDVSVTIPEVLRATFDGDDIRFSMDGIMKPLRTDLFLGGRIYLQRAAYTADIMASGELNQGLRNNLRGVAQASSVSAFERIPMLQRFKVDLRVEGDNDIFVRNNVSVVSLDLEIRPSLRVRGNLYNRPDLAPEERLVIDGEVSTLPDSSHIIYSGREFEVTSAGVDFGKGDFLSATVVAQRAFKSCQEAGSSSSGLSGPSTAVGNGGKEETVTLEIRYRLPTLDTPGVPSLQLSSDSGASSIDLATMVLTGACPSQLTAASSAQPALEVALSPMLNLIEAPLKQTLDIDLNLTPSGRGSLIVEADKALSKRLRLYSYSPVGSDDDGTVRRQFGLEYQINNFAFGDLSNQSLGQENNTTGQLVLMLNLD